MITWVDRLIDRTALALVDTSRRFAVPVLLLALAVTGALGGLAASRLSLNTDLDALLSPDQPWRQQDMAFSAAFPQFDNLLVAVVDGTTADAADDAAAALAAKLAGRTDLFRFVRRPDADPFFRREGLLLLPVKEVAAITAQMIEAQPFIGTLAADPSLRGLFGTLNLALEGVNRGDADFARLERPLAAIADSIAATLDGTHAPLSWQGLLTGAKPRPEELRRFVLFQVVRDFNRLGSSDDAIAAVRNTIHDLLLDTGGTVHIRLTGSVVIENEELATLKSGAGVTLALSLSLICLVLFTALRSWRLIVPILITLVAGLAATAGFAALAVGTLNPISVAFAVLFVGLAVDFSIQVTVRYREERFRHPGPVEALNATATGIGGSLFLAAATTAVGFLSFLPTAYIGVSQLGLIAGVGMIIALVLNFTLLPALLTLFRPQGEPASVGFAWAAPIDRFLIQRRRWVIAAAAVLAVLGLGLTPLVRFDFNPMDLRDPSSESIATARDLTNNPDTSPFTAEILVDSVDQARDLTKRLEQLPEVHRALSIASFLPDDQDAKLGMVQDAALLLGPTLSPSTTAPVPTPMEIRHTLALTVQWLRKFPAQPTANRLADLLDQATGRNAGMLGELNIALLGGLPGRLDALRDTLSAEPVSLDHLPEPFRSDWITPGGKVRIEVSPAGNAGDVTVLRRFVAVVHGVAPQATGSAVTTVESGTTIIHAFAEAGLISLVTITTLLWLVLRRLDDVLMVLAPLLLSALLTVAVVVTTGPVLNFANVIALPLLLGIGVAFNIYFVMNWRRGLVGPLQSSTARAVVFSALTTTLAFGSLALSNHPGTASMGVLLMISLSLTLLNALVTLPALLGRPKLDAGAATAPLPHTLVSER